MQISISKKLILWTAITIFSFTQGIDSKKGKEKIRNKEERTECSSSEIMKVPAFSTAVPVVKIRNFDKNELHEENDKNDLVTKKDLDCVWEGSRSAYKKLRVMWDVMKLHTKNSKSKAKVEFRDMPVCYYEWIATHKINKNKVQRVLMDHMGPNYSEDALNSFYKCQLDLQTRHPTSHQALRDMRNLNEMKMILWSLAFGFVVIALICDLIAL